MDERLATSITALEKRMEENHRRLFQEQLEARVQQMLRSTQMDKERELEASIRANREELNNMHQRLQAEKEHDLAAMEARWSNKVKQYVSENDKRTQNSSYSLYSLHDRNEQENHQHHSTVWRVVDLRNRMPDPPLKNS
jgi:hypothetical protein